MITEEIKLLIENNAVALATVDDEGCPHLIAVAHVKVAEVVNIARALAELKKAGVWTVGLAGDVPTAYDAVDFRLSTAIVLGAEGAGLRRLVRERCDRLASIPMLGHVGSLNVSVAAGVALFEAVRQRKTGS